MEKNEMINCNVVRDLLPLYADDVLSADSAAIVNAHLPECPPCASELEALRAPVPEKKRSPRQALKTTRRKLAAVLAAAVLLVAAVMMFGFKVMPSREYTPIAYYEGLFEPIIAYRTTADAPTGEGYFLKVQLARHPRFEYNAYGECQVEDVVTIDGQRVGVAYIQVMKDPHAARKSERKAIANGGTNPMIVSYGYSMLKLLPMSEMEKEEFRNWEIGAGVDRSGIDESDFASWARDIPITRLYYYSGPTKNLLNEALGWSERNGVLTDSVLIWDAETAGEPLEYPGVQQKVTQPAGVAGEDHTVPPFS